MVPHFEYFPSLLQSRLPECATLLQHGQVQGARYVVSIAEASVARRGLDMQGRPTGDRFDPVMLREILRVERIGAIE